MVRAGVWSLVSARAAQEGFTVGLAKARTEPDCDDASASAAGGTGAGVSVGGGYGNDVIPHHADDAQVGFEHQQVVGFGGAVFPKALVDHHLLAEFCDGGGSMAHAGFTPP